MASETPAQKKQKEQDYQNFASKFRPRPRYLHNTATAFLVGGAISVVGQVIHNLFEAGGLSPEQAGGRMAVILIGLGALFTGLGIYDELGRFGGAGSAIPITGFANSIVSPAMEFSREGYVFGMAARMFSVAGPVLAFGVTSAVVVGLLSWALGGGG